MLTTWKNAGSVSEKLSPVPHTMRRISIRLAAQYANRS